MSQRLLKVSWRLFVGPSEIRVRRPESTQELQTNSQESKDMIPELQTIDPGSLHSGSCFLRFSLINSIQRASMIVRSFTRLDYLSRSALLTVFKNKQNLLIFTVYDCMLNQHGLTKLSGSVQEHLAHCATTASYTYLHHIAQI